MVATSAGFFGHEGKVPLNSRGSVVETTVGRVSSTTSSRRRSRSRCATRRSRRILAAIATIATGPPAPRKTVLFMDAGTKTASACRPRLESQSVSTTCAFHPLRARSRVHTEVEETESQYNDGLITMGEKYNKVVDIWSKVTDEVSKNLISEISTEVVTDAEGNEAEQDAFNSIFMMVDSGARGSTTQIRQLAGMQGLMAKPSSEVIQTRPHEDFREVSDLQYCQYSRCA